MFLTLVPSTHMMNLTKSTSRVAIIVILKDLAQIIMIQFNSQNLMMLNSFTKIINKCKISFSNNQFD